MTGEDIRVLLVDDQALIRAGLATILESEPGVVVVGEAGDGAAAIAESARLRPDVVCLDVQMPGMDGLAACRAITARAGEPAVLVLTTFDRDDYLFEALASGASGFLLKTTPAEEIVRAVQVVARGDALLGPDVTRRVIERHVGAARPPADPRLGDLTEREREVLGLVARGMSNAEIARELFVGDATVKTHVSKVLLKLGLRDRIHAVVFAYEHGVAVPGA